MAIPLTVRRLLASDTGQYKVRVVQAGASWGETVQNARIPQERLARALLLKSGNARLLAVIPASHSLDLDALGDVFRRRFELCTAEEVHRHISDCEPAYLTPFGSLYGIKVIVDAALDGDAPIYFAGGTAGHFIRAEAEDFHRLLKDAWRSQPIARAPQSVAVSQDEVKRKIERVGKLPTMPGIAMEIIHLRANPYATASELAAVIEQDPSLSAQLLRYAGSAFYGYQGRLDTVEQAIVRVLGMDFVLDFAFGISLGRSFRHEKEGPIGLDAFWQHAMHCAALTQALCNTVEYSHRPSAGVAYLAGLLHNFGFLLLGHLFPEQFSHLNRVLAEEPERPVMEVEREVLGMTHTEIGLWLMEAWDVPVEIVEAVREHHDPSFRSDFSEYANLVCVANRLLKRYGIGDAESIDVPPELLAKLKLKPIQLEAALGAVMEVRDGLDFMARSMAA